MQANLFNPDICTVISGSFRKHLQHIVCLKREIEKHKIAVLSPAGDTSVNPDEEFIILNSDPVSNPKLLQDSVFAKIRRSSFIIVANVDGYLGNAAILEMGYAISQGVAIYTLEPIKDPNLNPYCNLISNLFREITSENIARFIDKHHNLHQFKQAN